jgi:hypothetical protein
MLAEHHARMKTSTIQRRCIHCTRPFVPDPRVGDRQVTCGREECQQARHNEQCKQWHENNKDVGASHYQDVIVPFRRAQPDYQRRWRLGCELREIREGSRDGSGKLMRRVRAWLRRAERLSSRAGRAVQTGVLAGELLERAKHALRGVATAIAQLEANLNMLQSLGI